MNTEYTNDRQELFTHDNRTMDLIDFLPPVGNIPDDKYQEIAEQRIEFISGIAYQKPENEVSFGEGWIGAANHASNMTQLERMIFEECYDGSNSVQRSGMNVPTIPKLEQIERIAGVLKCTHDQAEDLIDYFKIVDDSRRLWPTFIDWAIKKGVEPALKYFENLAAELTSDDCHVNDRQFSNGDPFTNVENEELDEIESVESGDFSYKINDLTMLETAWERLTLAGEDEPDGELLPHEVESVFNRYGFTTEDGRYHLDRGFPAPDVFRYNVINNQDDPKDTIPAVWPDGSRSYEPFMQRQPEKFKKLLRYIDGAKLDQINKLRKKAFGKLRWMSPIQRRIFWAHTKTRQSQLEMLKTCYISKILKSMDRVEKQSLTMIRNTKSLKQANLYWHWILSAAKGQPYNGPRLGRKGFILYVLKPELNKAQEKFKQPEHKTT